MKALDRAFIRECLREHHAVLGLSTKGDAEAALVSRGIPTGEAHNYVYGQTFKKYQDSLLQTTLDLLVDKQEAIIKHVEQSDGADAASYLSSIIRSHARKAVDRTRLASILMQNWDDTFSRGNGNLLTGVYQMFRRYKPSPAQLQEGGSLSSSGPTDVIVCEVIYVDSEAMEAVLVTSEGNVFWGTLHINFNGTMYGLFSRPREGSRGVLYRIYAVQIRHPKKKKRPIYSGLYIKSGDVTARPLAGESLFLWLSRSEHEALYDAMRQLLNMDFEFCEVSDRPAIMNYVSGYDEDDPGSAVRISDFDFISNITQPDAAGAILFREPSRAVDSEVLEARARDHPLSFFRREHQGDGA